MILAEKDAAAHRSTVTQPLIEGLRVAYAIDSDRTIAYIPEVQFEQWGVSRDDLHDAAIDNLVARSEAMNAHAAQDEDGRVNLILFQTMDGYDASRVLLPTLHEKLREYLGSPFGAGIPNRDILLCFRNDDETVDRLRKQIADDHKQAAARRDRQAPPRHRRRHRADGLSEESRWRSAIAFLGSPSPRSALPPPRRFLSSLALMTSFGVYTSVDNSAAVKAAGWASSRRTCRRSSRGRARRPVAGGGAVGERGTGRARR